MRIPLFPLLGFISGRRRQEVPVRALTDGSTDWLVGRNRYRRRAGSVTQINGVVESSWSAKARRLIAAVLPSNTNNYPTWLALFVNETSKMAQMAFRSTNGTPAARVVGSEFGTYHYGWPTTRTDGVPTFRVMPHVYDNERGGMTLGRLVSEKQRRFLCGGSRDLLRHGSEVVWGGYTSAPGRWNSRFNDSTATGDEAVECFPLGMIPPLQMPVIVAGTDLGTAVVGPWRGSDAFFYSVCFENEAGELSTYPIPMPPNAITVGYVGFGYKQVSSANPTHYFDSLVVASIPIGPPGTRARRLLRSTKVSVDTTALSPFPSTKQLYFCARIDNNTQTTYVLREGAEESLDSSPIPQLLPALTWAPRGRHVGRFDGRAVLGCLRPLPYALILAPWRSGTINTEIDDAALYAWPDYTVAVTPTQLVLRNDTTTTTFDLASRTLEDLTNAINVNQTYATVTHAKANYWSFTSGTYYRVILYRSQATAFADVYAGDVVVATGIPTGTKVVYQEVIAGNLYVHIDQTPTGYYNLVSVDYKHGTLDATDPYPWGCAVVPGSDGGGLAENLLRTLVATTGSTDSSTYVVAVTAADAPYITPGMLVSSTRYAAGTEVTGVSGANVTTSAKPSATGAGHSITFYYDTGDSEAGDTSDLTPSGAVSSSNTNPGECTVNRHFASAAETTDASDATYFKATLVCAAGPWTATLTDKFTQSATTLTTITNVRMTVRAQLVNLVESVLVTITPIAGSVTPVTISTSGEIADIIFDMPLNPATGLAWTAAAITALNPWGPTVTIAGSKGGDSGEVWVYEVKVEVSGIVSQPGYVRTYGNCWPVALPFNKTYLDRFHPEKSAIMFTGASPGSAQDAINTWFIGNRRSGPAHFGDLQGFADLGPSLLVFFAKGRMRLANPRTGLTHADEDYTLSVLSWLRGARSPYAIVSGNGWAITLADEGFFGCDAGVGENLISKALYDAEAAPGSRGELEYAIGACIAASDSGSDDYKIHASVEGGVLSVRYHSNAAATYPNREVRYDFSEGVGRTGLAEILRPDGSPYPWSSPLTLRHSCSAKMSQVDGAVHHFAAVDSNTGATDGKVIEIDTGTTDDGGYVIPNGYTGLEMPDNLDEIQPTKAYVVSTKAGDGFSVALTRTPEMPPSASAWDNLEVPTSGSDAYGRSVGWLPPEGALRRSAIAARIWDDGTGTCTEVTDIQVDADIVKSTTGTRSRP